VSGRNRSDFGGPNARPAARDPEQVRDRSGPEQVVIVARDPESVAVATSGRSRPYTQRLEASRMAVATRTGEVVAVARDSGRSVTVARDSGRSWRSRDQAGSAAVTQRPGRSAANAATSGRSWRPARPEQVSDVACDFEQVSGRSTRPGRSWRAAATEQVSGRNAATGANRGVTALNRAGQRPWHFGRMRLRSRSDQTGRDKSPCDPAEQVVILAAATERVDGGQHATEQVSDCSL
ncbi:hypothetical protein CYMTET_35399, partial [Cymbomonas tetramitiformis]